ncbi:MAG: outer membrane beta-barrel protein [Vicinamibacterales bacterium]
MRTLAIAVTAMLASTPLFAQEHAVTDTRGYVMGLGGFSVSVGNSTGNSLLEAGIRVAPHVMLFGNLGHFGNLQGDLQPSLDATTTSLASNQGLGVTGTGSVPATYGLAGMRVEMPLGSHLLPYVLGGVGAARLHPTTSLAFASGIMPDGSTPDVGTDVTAAVATAGLYTAPSASTAALATIGGGVQVPLAQHWIVDAGYRYARIAADNSLGAAPLNTNGMTFGFGYRF